MTWRVQLIAAVLGCQKVKAAANWISKNHAESGAVELQCIPETVRVLIREDQSAMFGRRRGWSRAATRFRGRLTSPWRVGRPMPRHCENPAYPRLEVRNMRSRFGLHPLCGGQFRWCRWPRRSWRSPHECRAESPASRWPAVAIARALEWQHQKDSRRHREDNSCPGLGLH